MHAAHPVSRACALQPTFHAPPIPTPRSPSAAVTVCLLYEHVRCTIQSTGLTYTSACIAQANGENIEYEVSSLPSLPHTVYPSRHPLFSQFPPLNLSALAIARASALRPPESEVHPTRMASRDRCPWSAGRPPRSPFTDPRLAATQIQRKKAGTTPGSGIRKPPAKNQQKRKTVGNAQVGRSAKTLRTPQQAKHTQQQTKKQQQRQQASKKTTGQRRQQQLQQTMTSQQKLEQQRKLKLQQEKAKKMRQQQQQRQQPKRMQPLGAELEMMGAPEEEFEYLDAELDLGENYFMQSPQLDEYPRRRIDVETPPPEADEPEGECDELD